MVREVPSDRTRRRSSPARWMRRPWAAAQVAQPAAATHKHYDVSAAGACSPGPNGELAPRLQNLGTHTFPVSTKRADGAALHQPGR